MATGDGRHYLVRFDKTRGKRLTVAFDVKGDDVTVSRWEDGTLASPPRTLRRVTARALYARLVREYYRPPKKRRAQ